MPIYMATGEALKVKYSENGKMIRHIMRTGSGHTLSNHSVYRNTGKCTEDMISVIRNHFLLDGMQ